MLRIESQLEYLGCSGFFKRSIHRHRHYVCKAQGELKDKCPVDKTHRNQCRSCRLARCFLVNMNKDGKVIHLLVEMEKKRRRDVCLSSGTT